MSSKKTSKPVKALTARRDVRTSSVIPKLAKKPRVAESPASSTLPESDHSSGEDSSAPDAEAAPRKLRARSASVTSELSDEPSPPMLKPGKRAEVAFEDNSSDSSTPEPRRKKPPLGSGSRIVKFDFPKFKGYEEVDVDDWLGNFEVLCAANEMDPAKSFPSYCDLKILSRLRLKRIECTSGTWHTLKRTLKQAYGKTINKLKLQHELQNRRQGVEESVSQYAEALDSIAVRMGMDINDIAGVFVAGLQSNIATAMLSFKGNTFEGALSMARQIEDNEAMRRPMAAIPLPPSSHPVLSTVVREQPEQPAWLTAVTSAMHQGSQERQQGYPQQQFRQGQQSSNRFNSHNQGGQFNDRRRRGGGQHFNGRDHQRSSQDRSRQGPPKKCAYCTYDGHTEQECHIKQELDRRRGKNMMTIANRPEDQQQGPTLTTEKILIGGAEDLISLIDSGATGSFIHKSALSRLKQYAIVDKPTCCFVGGNGLPVPIECAITTSVSIHDDEQILDNIFYVVSALPFDVVLGTDILTRAGAVIDVAKKLMSTRGGLKKLALYGAQSNVLNVATLGTESTTAAEDAAEENDFDSNSILQDLTADVDPAAETTARSPTINPELPKEQQQQLQQLVDQHAKVFQPANGREPCDFEPFEINTGDIEAIFSQARRIPYDQRETVSRHIAEYLSRGWIERSKSPWASPVLIVRRNGKERLCIDYRRLNEVTVPDRYPSPDIRDCLDQLAKCRFFTLCDADAAYHQCRVAQPEKLAFATHDGFFQPTVLLFGPRNAPAYFQRHMANAVQDIPHVSAYMDDIMVATETWEEHVIAVGKLLSRMAEKNLRLKPAKCQMGMFSVKYLGYLVGADGVAPDPEKVRAIKDLVAPTTVSGLRRFLGMCGYYQHFVQHFAELAAPLHQLTKKDVKWDWTEQHNATENIPRDTGYSGI